MLNLKHFTFSNKSILSLIVYLIFQRTESLPTLHPSSESNCMELQINNNFKLFVKKSLSFMS